jgi:hypothetical protein
MVALSLVVLLTFLIAAVTFMLATRMLAREPDGEAWLVAAAVVTISLVLLLILSAQDVLLERTPGLIHAGFAGLAALWAILRRTTSLLGAPAPDSITPAVSWWVISLPAGAAILSSTYLVGIPAITPLGVGLLQIAALTVAWLVRPRRMVRAGAGDGHAVQGRSSRSSPHVDRPPEPASARVFVCYRREDSADVTGRIYDRLAARFGRDHVFKDVDSIPLGVDFRTHLQQMVGRCDAVVVVIGEKWLAMQPGETRRLDEPHDFVRIELEAALQRRIPVIPVLVGQAKVPAEHALPQSLAPLAYRQGTAVRPDPDFHRDMDRLIQGLEGQLRAGGGSGEQRST